MKRMQKKTILTSLALIILNQAEADGWDDLGGILKTACNISQGNAGNGFNIPTGELGEKTIWLCQLQSAYAFINNDILNGDWHGFMSGVAGNYLSEFLNYVGSALPDSPDLNFDTWLKKPYEDFRKALYGSASQIFSNGRGMYDDAPDDSTAGRVRNLINSSPTLSLSYEVSRAEDIKESLEKADKSVQMDKMQRSASNALEAHSAQALNNATKVVGTPLNRGIADKYVEAAKTALSSREVQELQLQLISEMFKSNTTNDVTAMNQITLMAQQQVMTNRLLMEQNQKIRDDSQRNELEFLAAVEAVQATLDHESKKAAAEIKALSKETAKIIRMPADINLGD